MRIKPFPLHPGFPSKCRGFSLLEILIAVAILSIIIGVSIYSMNAARVSFNVTLANKELQAEVRRTMGWIVKDVRQAVSYGIANNNPTPDYISFRQVTGWDTVNNTFLLGDHYVEYIYDDNLHQLSRRTSDLNNNILNTWILSKSITAAPFYTINSSGNTVALNSTDLLTSKQLVIILNGQTSVSGLSNLTHVLRERVLIRNGE